MLNIEAAKRLDDDELYQLAVGRVETEEHEVPTESGISVLTVTRRIPPDTVACMVWLNRHDPDRWRL